MKEKIIAFGKGALEKTNNFFAEDSAGEGRNCGIDILKMLSMLLIVMIHVLGGNNLIFIMTPGTFEYGAAWLLYTIAYPAVNCFALASGYVMADIEFKYRRVVLLWLRVLFYSVIITSAFAVFGGNDVKITGEDWLHAWLPVSYTEYWYFTAYFGMFLFMPFINAAVSSMKNFAAAKALLVLLIIVSLTSTFSETDPFYMRMGYSTVWVSIIYAVGAYFKRFGINVKRLVAAAGIALSILLTWLSKLVIGEFSPENSELLFKYCSPTVILASVSIFALFVRIDIKNRVVLEIIKFFTSLTFSVYLIHAHPMMWKYVFAFDIENIKGAGFVGAAVGISLLIYAVCSLIDMARTAIFKVAKVKDGVDFLALKIHKLEEI